jgi:hypothetical protein
MCINLQIKGTTLTNAMVSLLLPAERKFAV